MSLHFSRSLRRRRVLLFFGVAFTSCVTAQAVAQVAPAEPVRTTRAPAVSVPLTSAITRAEIEAHVRFLASDELQGRMTGTSQADQAARYLAHVLEMEGVEPAGDEHTFLQAVELERTRTLASPELSIRSKKGEVSVLAPGRDFDFSGPPVDASDLYLVVVANETDLPKSADPKVALFVDATFSKRKQWLEKAGLGQGEGFGLLVQPGSTKAGAEERFETRPASLRRKGTVAKRGPNLRLNGDWLERVRHGEVERLSVRSHVESDSVTSYNVLGRISGQGTHDHPELAVQAIVLSAHYDHLGENHSHAEPTEKSASSAGAESTQGSARAKGSSGTPPAEVDRIYNGADDDASGCAAVLEIAGAFAAAAKPARTLIFLFATGEEIGLLGTDDYLDHPAVALDHTIANLNFEMIGRPDPLVGGPGAMWLTGFEKTNLGPAFESAGLSIKIDPRPAQHFYERSDNIAFVHRGIVGQTFSTFNLHGDYHRVTDEADRLDFAHMEACVRTGYRAVSMVAEGTLTPAWVKGQEPPVRK